MSRSKASGHHVSGPVMRDKPHTAGSKGDKGNQHKVQFNHNLHQPLMNPSFHPDLVLPTFLEPPTYVEQQIKPIELTRLTVQVQEAKNALKGLCDEMPDFVAEDRKKYVSLDVDLIHLISNVTLICRSLFNANIDVKHARDLAVASYEEKLKETEDELLVMETRLAEVCQEKQTMTMDHTFSTRGFKDEIKVLKAEHERMKCLVSALESEKMDLKLTINKLEAKLLDLPRIEEHFLKKAKADIRHKEMLLNRMEAKWKR